MKPEVRIYPDLEALSKAAAEELINVYENAIHERGIFTLTLSGGSTPNELYRLLAADYRNRLDWKKVHVFWGDERYVPPASPESNYGAAYMTLISKVPIPLENVHPVPTESNNPELDATVYENEVRGFLQSTGSEGFDIMLLGLGVDGHTASLFPESSVLREEKRLVVLVIAPSTYTTPQRITLTLPLINSSKNIFFLVSGPDKKEALASAFSDEPDHGGSSPAAMVRPQGRLIWFLDEDASQ